MPTNDHELNKHGERSAENPGYETTDVNVNGVVVFLAGLMGFLLIFFIFCFGMGKVINHAIQNEDGKLNKWNGPSTFNGTAHKGQNLESNADVQQKQLQEMTKDFPNPRLDIDDGNQATADLHAREDLLLNHYSTIQGSQNVRIPIDVAMQQIAKKGLPVAPQAATSQQLAEDTRPEVQTPLTSGFARTGYELEVMEARSQKLIYGKATEGAEHAELAPAK